MRRKISPKGWNWLRFKLKWNKTSLFEALEFRKVQRQDPERDSLGLSVQNDADAALERSKFARVWPFGWGA